MKCKPSLLPKKQINEMIRQRRSGKTIQQIWLAAKESGIDISFSSVYLIVRGAVPYKSASKQAAIQAVKQGMSKSDVAYKFGVSVETIRRWCNG